ncbi:hypothetical protein DAI22_10g006700 [Oryza sativa Japonica Group]|nr:hypothetical protein DAI22_10g006700 [Oryza sativa Japonica Group]
MLSASFSAFPSFHVVAVRVPSWRLLSIIAERTSRRRARAATAHIAAAHASPADTSTARITPLAHVATARRGGGSVDAAAASPDMVAVGRRSPQGSSGMPHSPGLPAYWLAGSVLSWPRCGISPERLLSEMSIWTRKERLEKESGMPPCSRLRDTSNTPRLRRRPSDAGISPVRLFRARSSTWSTTMSPNSSGISPSRLLYERSRYSSVWYRVHPLTAAPE